MTTTQWQYLEQRPHAWRKQLYLKGKKLTAFGVLLDMIVNGETREEAANNWDLPLAAIDEVVQYCSTHQEFLKKEAHEERRYLEEQGIALEPKINC
jgi:uncharacterized protein (DUF433 family)